MSTNARDELADSLWRLAPSMYEMADCTSLADDLVADGWRKVDPAADTQTEWGVDHGEYGIGSAGAEDSARARAEHYRGYGAAVRLVSRTVTTGPWREVEQ